MFAEVVVLTYQAPDIGYFTYKIPENLKSRIRIGQIVEVPFGRRNPLGVIINTRSNLVTRRDLVIRPINQVVTEYPTLLPYQLKLLAWMSNYYFAPTVNCLEAILPFNEIQLRKLLSDNTPTFPVNRQPSTMNQTLVLVPSINRIPETLAKHKSKEYLIFHNQLTSKEKFDIWNNLLSKNVETVFGSRSAIFLPFQNLKKIVIYDEHETAYKDDRSPYYDSLTVLDKISQLTGAKLEIFDDSPKVSTFLLMKNSIKFSGKNPLLKTRIVSQVDEKLSGNKSPISELLQKLIIQNYKLKGSTLLFLNKKKGSGSFYCRSCQVNLFLEKAPKQCPECQSFDFFFNSLNIESLKKEIEKLIPNANVNVISEGPKKLPTTRFAREARRAYYLLPTINIATSVIFYSQNLIKYDLLAHISVDQLLNLPEYLSAEKTYQQISDLKKLGKEKSILILQTYDPQNLIVQSAANGDYSTIFHNELAERKQLAYPPYALIVKLTVKGKSPEKTIEKAADFAEKLNIPGWKITGPFASIFRKKTPSYNIILRHRLNSYSQKEREEVIKKLKPGLTNTGRDWQIIVEPENLN